MKERSDALFYNLKEEQEPKKKHYKIKTWALVVVFISIIYLILDILVNNNIIYIYNNSYIITYNIFKIILYIILYELLKKVIKELSNRF